MNLFLIFPKSVILILIQIQKFNWSLILNLLIQNWSLIGVLILHSWFNSIFYSSWILILIQKSNISKSMSCDYYVYNNSSFFFMIVRSIII